MIAGNTERELRKSLEALLLELPSSVWEHHSDLVLAFCCERAELERELEQARDVIRAADALAERWVAVDAKAWDFGRANELVAYQEARAALAVRPDHDPTETRA